MFDITEWCCCGVDFRTAQDVLAHRHILAQVQLVLCVIVLDIQNLLCTYI